MSQSCLDDVRLLTWDKQTHSVYNPETSPLQLWDFVDVHIKCVSKTFKYPMHRDSNTFHRHFSHFQLFYYFLNLLHKSSAPARSAGIVIYLWINWWRELAPWVLEIGFWQLLAETAGSKCVNCSFCTDSWHIFIPSNSIVSCGLPTRSVKKKKKLWRL